MDVPRSRGNTRRGRKVATPQRATATQAAVAAWLESEARYRDIFENANDAIATFTLDGTITSVNRGAERLLGWTREELLGQHYRTVVTPATDAFVEERERRVLAGEKLPSSTFEADLVHKEGYLVPVEARTRVIRDGAGNPIGYQGIYRDSTERHRLQAALQQSEARYRLIFENCPDLIYVTDTAGQLLDANPALIEWAGFALEELRGKHFLDFYAAGNASQEDVLRSFAALLRGQPVRALVVKAKNASGELRD